MRFQDIITNFAVSTKMQKEDLFKERILAWDLVAYVLGNLLFVCLVFL